MWKWGKLELGWGFAALIVLALLGGAGPALPPVLLAAACHELGHLSALWLAGARVERLRLNAFGAEIRADTRRLSYPREIACTLAGPAVNLALALLLARATLHFTAAGANLVLGCFNLLPIPALDGGHILFLVISTVSEKLFGRKVPMKYEAAINMVFLALLMGLMLFVTFNDVRKLFS